MAGAKRRSPTSTLVTKHSIQNAGSILGGLPEKPKEIWSLREAIDALKDEITLALDRGYTYPEISQMLTTRGVEISASTLKYYLSSVKRQDPNAKPRRRRRTLGAGISAESLNLGVSDDAPVVPKRRGRAPGSKNLTPAEKAAAKAAKVPAKRGPKPKVKVLDEAAPVKTRKPRATKAEMAALKAAAPKKTAAVKKTAAPKATATKKTAAVKKTATKVAAVKKTAVKATTPKTATKKTAVKDAAAKTTATKAKTGTGRGRRKATA
jgi:hypothetical protein